MNTGDILSYTSREEFRQWLMEHHDSAKECWVTVKKGKPSCGDGCLFYLDAVEEALCFGWIDSTNKTHGGRTLQRFSPRKKSSPWSELNLERCRQLEKLQLMTESGRKALPETPDTGTFAIDPDIVHAFGKTLSLGKISGNSPNCTDEYVLTPYKGIRARTSRCSGKGSSVLYRDPNRGRCSARGMITAGY